MAKNNPFFFFDVEAGGFSGKESSILSISWGTDPKKIHTEYAKPVPGSFVSKWSEKKVWEPIQQLGRRGQQIRSEEEILKTFLGQLEAQPRGTTIAGWNIGYTARPQPAAGFDIPMVMTRAEAYGLGERFGSAFRRLGVRDIGQEYAWKISGEIPRYQHLVSQGLLPERVYEQAFGYRKAGIALARQYGSTNIPRELSETKKWMAGWKQEMVAGLRGMNYQAHLSSEDVRVGLGLAEQLGQGPVFRSEADVVSWGRQTFKNMLTSSALKGPRIGQEAVGRWESILAGAMEQEKIGGDVYKGFTSEFLTDLEREVATRGGKMDLVKQGLGIIESGRGVSATRPPAVARVGEFASQAWKAARKSPFLAIGAGAAAIWMLEPGNWFSGKDDAYNTIEGLRHGGEAQKMRRYMTDFGSGSLRNFVSAAWKTMKQAPGRTKRAATVAGWMNKESTRAVTNITKEIVHGAKAAQLLELGVLGVTAAEGVHSVHAIMAAGALTPGIAASAAAGFVGTKYLYEVIKKRQAIKKAIGWARQNPLEAKEGARQAAAATRKELTRYVQRGQQTVSAQYVKAGGGEYGKQMVLGSLETRFGINLAPLEKRLKGVSIDELKRLSNVRSIDDLYDLARIIGKDDAHNIIEGLRHGHGQVQSRQTLKSVFGSGWLGLLKGLTKTKDLAKVGATALWVAQPSSWFSGKDDAYNTIEGLPHGGQAERMRKILTDFGSGWDMLRGLVRTGETFEQMLMGSSFQMALQSAKQGGKLGAGKYGIAYKMTAKFRGKEIEFARKFAHAGEEIGETEVKAMWKLRGDIAPTPYAHTKEYLDMELFKGETVEQLMARGAPETGEALTKLQGLSAQYGKLHGDVHVGNVMRIHNGQYGLIDFGKTASRDLDLPIPAIHQGYGQSSGLAHGGMAEELRDFLTDFSSPWKGIIKFFGKVGQKLGTYGRKMATPFRKKVWKVGELTKSGDFAISTSDMLRMSEAHWEEVHKVALGKSPAQALAKVQREMSAPPIITRAQVEEFNKNNVILSRDMAVTAEKAGKPLPSGEEIIRQLQTQKQQELESMLAQLNPPSQMSIARPRDVTGVGKAPIEKTGVRGEAIYDQIQAPIEKRQKWQAKHLESMVRRDTNATNPGMRHRQQTGKIVK